MHNSSVEDTNYKANPTYVNGILMDFSRPKIMGILNITSDSFFSESRLESDKDLMRRAEKHLNEGADILDIGAFSTRPNGESVDELIEFKRISHAVEILHKEFANIPISVDTFRGKVAQVAIDKGASIINDISGFQFDSTLLDVLESSKICYILMHVEGTFETMHQVGRQQNDIVARVGRYFEEKLAILKSRGVTNVILDPGFGFSKTMQENHELLHRVDELRYLHQPILVGISRKSMIYKKLGITAEESLNGTTALNSLAILKGANILRVHDVSACKEVVELLL